MAAFLLKKVISSLLLLPGILVVLLILLSAFAKKGLRLALICLAAILYFFSISPGSRLVLGALENAYPVPPLSMVQRCDAFVVLGGGINDLAPDISGEGLPTGDALSRLIAGTRLYRQARKPIIISGGAIYGRKTEAEVAEKVLLSLGVDKADIIREGQSRDTYENALYVKDICQKKGFNRILLITSAYHMKRSVMLFRTFSMETVPFPVNHLTSPSKRTPLDFLPDAGNLLAVSLGLREYLGILFYKLTL